MKKFIGGLRWGNSFWSDRGDYGNATIPFGSLKIEKDCCVLSWTFWGMKTTSYILPFSDIEYVTTKTSFFSRGILFVHKNNKIPKYLLFWTSFYLLFWRSSMTQKVLTILKSNGIKIK